MRRTELLQSKLDYRMDILEVFTVLLSDSRGTQWCSWLRHGATSRKVAGSIPDGVNGIFH